MHTEVAWAAGFFDGEGHVARLKGNRLGIFVGQKQPECLLRLQAAIGGKGRVYGPYTPKSHNGRVHYQFQIQKQADVHAALSQLWPFLSLHKKNQALAAGYKVVN